MAYKKSIKLWRSKIVEKEETGNFKNSLGQNYFSEKHDKMRMIFFCESMIDRLEKNLK